MHRVIAIVLDAPDTTEYGHSCGNSTVCPLCYKWLFNIPLLTAWEWPATCISNSFPVLPLKRKLQSNLILSGHSPSRVQYGSLQLQSMTGCAPSLTVSTQPPNLNIDQRPICCCPGITHTHTHRHDLTWHKQRMQDDRDFFVSKIYDLHISVKQLISPS